MKDLLLPFVFLLSLTAGMLLAAAFDFRVIGHDQVMWGRSTPSTMLFTLEEANALLGKRIRTKAHTENFDIYAGRTGTIVFPERTGKDRFLVLVYWDGKTRIDRKPDVMLLDKIGFRDFELLEETGPQIAADGITE